MKQIAGPSLMHETGCPGLCTGMTLGEGMGREVGGGFWIWIPFVSLAYSCQCMAKPTTML